MNKIKFQKMITMVVVGTVFSSQIGCANKAVVPLNQAQFRTDYSYKIKTNQNTTLEYPAGIKIENTGDRLLITQNNETKYLLHNQVVDIEGVSLTTTAPNVGTTALIGAGIGSAAGSFIGVIGVFLKEWASVACSDTNYKCGLSNEEKATYVLAGAGIGAGAGGLLGLLVGALIPHHSKIQITPIIAPSAAGVSTGANMQVHF